MADKPKTWRDTVSDAADSAITWARDKANVPDDIEGFEDYLLNTRSSPDDVSWGNPYFKEDPEKPGRITPTRRHRYHGHPHYPHRPPSSKEIADFDKQEQHELLDDIRGIGSIADLRKIAKDLNVDVSDVSSLPRTVIRNLLREYGPSSRPSEDKQERFHAGWEIDPATGQRKPKMVEYDHARKKAARKAWDKHKFKEDYAEGLRLHNEEERLKRANYANKRFDPKYDRQRGPGESYAYEYAPEEGQFEESSNVPGRMRWVKGKDEVLKGLQKRNEAGVTEGGAGLSDVHPRVERD